jgi:DNA-binding IclR family transcriptional regulator
MSLKETTARVWQGIEAVTDPERKFVAAVGLEYHLDHMSPEEIRAWENAVRLAATTLSGTAFPHAQ